METFKEFLDHKPWKAKRQDVVSFWQSLKPNMPIKPTPVSRLHKGTRFDQDGIRITGSPDFINGVISRLKDMLQYDAHPGTKLDVEYRQIETKDGEVKGMPIYVFYIHVLEKTEDSQPRNSKLKKFDTIKPFKPFKPFKS